MQLPSEGAITGPLSVGSRGPDVRTLQEALNRTVPPPRLQADGAFGIKTDAAVRAFQRSKNLKSDGIVGPRTAAALGLRYTAGAPAAPRPATILPGPERPRPAGAPDENAIAQLVEAVIQGLNEVYDGVLRIVDAVDELPDVVAQEIRSLVNAPRQAAIGILRDCIRVARANAAAAGPVIQAAIRGAVNQVTGALQSILAVLSRLPDLLGLTGVADRIRSIITKLQRAVEGVIDIILQTVIGAARSVVDAAGAILGILRGVAAG
jgi:hypothetical protein